MCKEFQDELNPEGIFTKNAPHFFIAPWQGSSHLRQLLQNPWLKEMSGVSSSPIYSVKNLRSTALLNRRKKRRKKNKETFFKFL